VTNISLKSLAVLAGCALITGCAIQAPPYVASIDNVSVLKRSGQSTVRLGAFDVVAASKGAVSISLRGNPMMSPVGGNYAAYLADALKQELQMAKRLDPASTLEVSGVLLGTDIDAAIGTGTGFMEARIVVKRDGQLRYEKTKRGDARWDSSFVGAIAIPDAQKNYPVVVQRLLEALYNDADFQNALK
jgi:hypothetical protein